MCIGKNIESNMFKFEKQQTKLILEITADNKITFDSQMKCI